MTSDEPDRVGVFTAAIAAAAALAIGAGGATAHAAPAKPVIHSVHVKASPTQRLVAISTVGRPFQHVAVCDLRATTCVTAGRAGRNEWRAVLPAQEPDGHYRIGVIARSGRDYVTKSFGNAEAAEPFMP